MSHATRRLLHHTQDLRRLRELREQRAHAAVEAATQQLQVTQAEAEASHQRWQALRALRRDNLVHRVHPGDAAARAHSFVDARLVELDDRIERARDAVLDAEDALHAATSQAREAQAAWARSRARTECAKQQQATAGKAHRLDHEHRDTEGAA